MSTPLLNYKGPWNAVTNVPYLIDTSGTTGDCYIIVAQTQATHYNIYDRDLGSGNKSWIALHYIYYTGSQWDLYEHAETSGGTGGGTVTSVGATGGTGISVTGGPITTSGIFNIVNTAPDQVVDISGGTGIAVSGSYPNFLITNTQSSGSTVTPAALSTSGDTNITLQASGTTATALLQAVKLTVGWQGTLADSRIASAAIWNAKQAALNGTGLVKSTNGVITYTSGTTSQFVKGDGSLDSNTYLTSGITSVVGTAGEIYTSGTTAIHIGLPDLGIAGTYGSGTKIPVITTDIKGRVSNISEISTSGVTSSRVINTTPPLQGGGDLSADRTFTILDATSGTTGALSSTDWTTFNLKVPANRVLTINGDAKDLSLDRSWSISAAPAGLNTQLQYNSSGTTAGAAFADIDSDGILMIPNTSGVTSVAIPGKPSAKIWSNGRVGQGIPAVTSSVGTEYVLQASLGERIMGRFLPNGNTITADGHFLNCISTLSTSSALVAASYDASNLLPNKNYYRYTTGASTNQSAEVYMSTAGKGPIIGNGAYGNGGKLVHTFGFQAAKVAMRFFSGYSPSTTNLTTTVDPSALTNIIGFGKDQGDTNIQLMVNDGSGTATKTDTDLPAAQNQVYRVTIFIPSVGTPVYLMLEVFGKGSVSRYVSGAISSDIPAAGTLLYNHLYVNTGTVNSNAVALAVIQIQEELFI